jgi:hypothetical protein
MEYFTAIWYILRPYGNIVVIWYIFPRFGQLCQEKSGNPGVSVGGCWCIPQRKNGTEKNEEKLIEQGAVQ